MLKVKKKHDVVYLHSFPQLDFLQYVGQEIPSLFQESLVRVVSTKSFIHLTERGGGRSGRTWGGGGGEEEVAEKVWGKTL